MPVELVTAAIAAALAAAAAAAAQAQAGRLAPQKVKARRNRR